SRGTGSSVTPITLTATLACASPPCVGTAIGIAGQPGPLAITPNGQTVYVLTGFGSVTPISVATNSAGTAIRVSGAAAIAITTDGKTAYMANCKTAGSVTPLDLATGTLGAAINVGNQPQGFAISPDGRTGYATFVGENTVTPIALATNTALASIYN